MAEGVLLLDGVDGVAGVAIVNGVRLPDVITSVRSVMFSLPRARREGTHDYA